MIAKNPEGERLKTLPPYLFAELDRTKERISMQNGQKIIDLGEGNPDIIPNVKLIGALINALKKKENHRYPSYTGKISARIAVAKWYKKRFNVNLDPDTEVAMLIGSKEGMAHLFWAIIDKGDIVYVPSPAYPIYHNQTKLSGGIVKVIPLIADNNFLPDLDIVKPHKRLKLLC
ncbi:MAG: aminotransferase class I/II-fold pyridoxal phosphate-dependent enzyme, partial [candidate division WOR-3 bacterium]|nr:aminotransferase class I/II-fold pyridoxal phosphate-dependent enzyme [candidate division WOR-3 bacterium]